MPIAMMADLPANTTAGARDPNAFRNYAALQHQVIMQCKILFVFFPHVVRRRRNHQLGSIIWNFAKEGQTVSRKERDFIV